MKKNYLNTWLLLLACWLGIGSVNGQLVYEPFAGTGTLNGNNGWVRHNGTADQVQRISGSLSYASLPSSTGNKIEIKSTDSEDLNKDLGADQTGDVYFSAIINVLNTTNMSTTGDYFLHFGTTAGASVTVFPGRLYIRGTGASTFNLGILNQSGGTPVTTYLSTNYNTGTSYFVVVKYNTTSNTASLWVNPATGGTEPTPDATNNTGTNTAAQIRSICIRQGGTSPNTTGNVEIDEIRVGTTWASVTPAPAATPTISVSPASLSGFSTTVGTPSAAQNYTVSGSNLTADITLAAPPAGYEFKRSTDATYTSSPIVLTQSGGNVPATTINVRLTGASAGAFSGNIAHTSTGATTQNVALSGNVASGPTITPIADIRNAIDANGVQTAPFANGTSVTIQGQIYGVNRNVDATPANGTSQRFEFTVIDNSSVRNGIVIRANGNNGTLAPTDLQEGDVVTVVGLVSQFNGLTQVGGNNVGDITSVTRVSTGGTRKTPVVSTIIGEDEESNLIRLNGAIVTSWPTSWTGTGQNANITVGSNNYTLRITSASELWNTSVTDVFGPTATLPVTTDALIGLGGQFDSTSPFTSGYQIFVYKLSDVLMPTASVPTITVSPASLSGFSTTVGTPSAAQNYTVSGSNLTADITLAAPPAGYEFKRSTDATYTTSPIVLTQSGGNVPATTINVRLTGATAGTFTGNIAHTSTGATTQNVALNGSVSSGSFSPVYEPFAGTGVLQGQNAWASHSGTAGQIQRIAGNLVFSGLATSSGNKTAIIAGNGEDVNKDLGTDLTGDIYYSALINISNTTGLNTAGDYFLHFATTAGTTGVTAFPARLHARATGATTFNLGIVNQSGGASTPSYLTTEYNIGTTYFVVVRHNTSTNTTSLWVNPTPGAAEPTPALTNNTGTNAAPQIRSICIRQGGSAAAGTGNVEIDEIRVGTTWADVTPAGPLLPILTATPASLTGFTTNQGAASSSQSYTLTGTDLTPASGSITITAPTSFQISTDNTNFSGSLNLSYSGGALAATTIYVRIAASASAGAVSGSVAHNGGGATNNVAVAGTVNSVPATLTTSVPSLDFGTVPKNELSSSLSYKLIGAGLPIPTTGTNSVVVNAPNNFQVSKNNTEFTSFITFTTAELNNAGATGIDVFVRFAPTSDIDGLKGGDISHSVAALTPTLVTNLAVRGTQAAPNSLNDAFAAYTQVYPNPANKTIQIKTDRSYQVEIQDITGRKVGQFTSNEMISVENLPNGLYFLQFNNENIKFVKRLVIQK